MALPLCSFICLEKKANFSAVQGHGRMAGRGAADIDCKVSLGILKVVHRRSRSEEGEWDDGRQISASDAALFKHCEFDP